MIRASIDSMCRGIGPAHYWWEPSYIGSDLWGPRYIGSDWRKSLCGRRALQQALIHDRSKPVCRTCARVARLAGLKEE